MIGFISTLVTISLNHNWYSAIADLLNFQVTVTHALGFSVSTSRLLAKDLNTETITPNHYEVFLSSITLYSFVLICTQQIFTIHYRHPPFSPLHSQLPCSFYYYYKRPSLSPINLRHGLRTENTAPLLLCDVTAYAEMCLLSRCLAMKMYFCHALKRGVYRAFV
jgi:hypothetical protein